MWVFLERQTEDRENLLLLALGSSRICLLAFGLVLVLWERRFACWLCVFFEDCLVLVFQGCQGEDIVAQNISCLTIRKGYASTPSSVSEEGSQTIPKNWPIIVMRASVCIFDRLPVFRCSLLYYGTTRKFKQFKYVDWHVLLVCDSIENDVRSCRVCHACCCTVTWKRTAWRATTLRSKGLTYVNARMSKDGVQSGLPIKIPLHQNSTTSKLTNTHKMYYCIMNWAALLPANPR